MNVHQWPEGPQPLGHFGVRKKGVTTLELQDVEGSCDHMIEASGQAVPLVHHIPSCQAVHPSPLQGSPTIWMRHSCSWARPWKVLDIQFSSLPLPSL